MTHIKLARFEGTRRPMNEDDWGDSATIGLHLKTRDPKSEAFAYQFAIYLGGNKIGIIDWSSHIVNSIQYITSEEMHEKWILD
jgi:hypothetical protein